MDILWTAYGLLIGLPRYDARTFSDGSGQTLQPLVRLSPAELGPMPGPGLSDGFKIDQLGRMWLHMLMWEPIVDDDSSFA